MDRVLTVVLIPLVLLTQVYGPLFGSLFAVPLRGRKLSFAAVFLAGFATVAWARFTYNPPCSALTPQGYVNWWSAQNPPDYPPLVYALWALFIGASFLLWWRPLWQALTIVSFGWVWAWASYVLTDNAASNWCFFVSLYAVFVLIYAFMVPDRAQANVAPADTPTTTTRSQV